MTTKHTPGQWSVRDHHTDEECLYIEFIRGGIASIFTDAGNSIETDRANAALIAAAPELLEACMDFVSKVRDFQAGKINLRLDDFCFRAEAAIIKAGYQPAPFISPNGWTNQPSGSVPVLKGGLGCLTDECEFWDCGGESECKRWRSCKIGRTI